MRKMKDSGLGYLGAIPAHWNIERIKNHLRFSNERNPGDATILSLYRELGIVPKDSRDDNHNVTSEDTSNYRYVHIGDLVVNKMKAWQGSMGVSEYEGVVSPAYYVYRFKTETLNKRFVHYLLRSKCYAEEFRRLSGGIRIGQWDLSKIDFENTSIAIPPIDDQVSIAQCIDNKLSSVDMLIQNVQAQIEHLQRYKQSLITETVTKGLDSSVLTKDSGIDWIGKIPQHWTVKRTKNIATSFEKGNGITKEDIVESGDSPCVRYGEIYTKYDTSFTACITRTNAENVSSPQYFSYGDILFAGTGELVEEIGKNIVYLGQEPCLAGGDIIVMRHNENPLFLSFALNSTISQAQKSCSKAKLKVVHISATDIGNIIIPLPPKEEQEIISTYLSEKCSKIDRLIAIKQSKIEQLEQYKKSIIYEYVTGKKEAK